MSETVLQESSEFAKKIGDEILILKATVASLRIRIGIVREAVALKIHNETLESGAAERLLRALDPGYVPAS